MLSEHHKEIINQLNELNNTGDFDQAKNDSEAFIASLNNDEFEAMYEALNVLAFSYIRRGMAKEAIPHVVKMLQLSTEFSDDTKKQREFRCHNILGLLHFEISLHTQGLVYLEKAAILAKELGNKHFLMTINGNLGLLHSSLAHDEIALDYLLESMRLAEELSKTDQLAIVYDNMATLFNRHADYTTALQYYTNSLTLHESLHNKEGIGRALGHIGVVYLNLQNDEKALEYFTKALSIHKEIGYQRGIESWTGCLGDVYKKTGDYEKSLEYYVQAYEVSKELGNEGGSANWTANMGDMYALTKHYDKAHEYYEQALQTFRGLDVIIEEIRCSEQVGVLYADTDNPRYNPEKAEEILLDCLQKSIQHSMKGEQFLCHEKLSNLFKQLQQWEKAYNHYTKFIEIKEEVQSNEAKDKVKDLEFKRAYEEKEKERLLELTRLKEKENLLHDILPSQIAERIVAGEKTIADSHNDISVIFIDIVGFTSINNTLEPSAVVTVLNAFYSMLDQLAKKHDIEKIKTIGDSYMAVCGLEKSEDHHRDHMLSFALDILSNTQEFMFPSGEALRVRIGIHSGEAVAGVIGDNKFSYDVWGDTVNVAARLESSGIPDAIHLSTEYLEGCSVEALLSSYTIENRGEIDLKGKGLIKTCLIAKKA